MLKDCFMSPSALYLYPSGSPSSCEPSLPRPDESGVLPAPRLALPKPPPLLPSISRYVRKLPDTLLALHDFPSVHLLMPASLSSQTKTEPDLMDWRSFSDSRLCTRGRIPILQASKSLMASAGVRTKPWYVSIILAVVYVSDGWLVVCLLQAGIAVDRGGLGCVVLVGVAAVAAAAAIIMRYTYEGSKEVAAI